MINMGIGQTYIITRRISNHHFTSKTNTQIRKMFMGLIILSDGSHLFIWKTITENESQKIVRLSFGDYFQGRFQCFITFNMFDLGITFSGWRFVFRSADAFHGWTASADHSSDMIVKLSTVQNNYLSLMFGKQTGFYAQSFCIKSIFLGR